MPIKADTIFTTLKWMETFHMTHTHINVVLQVVKFYTIVNWEKILKNWRFRL